jgi:hypothetical protein
MPIDPFLALNAMIRAEAARSAEPGPAAGPAAAPAADRRDRTRPRSGDRKTRPYGQDDGRREG